MNNNLSLGIDAFYKSNVEAGFIEKARGYPTGTVRKHGGVDHIKGADGEWRAVKNKTPKTKSDLDVLFADLSTLIEQQDDIAPDNKKAWNSLQEDIHEAEGEVEEYMKNNPVTREEFDFSAQDYRVLDLVYEDFAPTVKVKESTADKNVEKMGRLINEGVGYIDEEYVAETYGNMFPSEPELTQAQVDVVKDKLKENGVEVRSEKDGDGSSDFLKTSVEVANMKKQIDHMMDQGAIEMKYRNGELSWEEAKTQILTSASLSPLGAGYEEFTNDWVEDNKDNTATGSNSFFTALTDFDAVNSMIENLELDDDMIEADVHEEVQDYYHEQMVGLKAGTRPDPKTQKKEPVKKEPVKLNVNSIGGQNVIEVGQSKYWAMPGERPGEFKQRVAKMVKQDLGLDVEGLETPTIKEANEYIGGQEYNSGNFNITYELNQKKDGTIMLDVMAHGKRGYPRDADKKAMNAHLPQLPTGYAFANKSPVTYDGKPMTSSTISDHDEYYDDRGYQEAEFSGGTYYEVVKYGEEAKPKEEKKKSTLDHTTQGIKDSLLGGVAEWLGTTKSELDKTISSNSEARKSLSDLAKHLKPILDSGSLTKAFNTLGIYED